MYRSGPVALCCSTSESSSLCTWMIWLVAACSRPQTAKDLVHFFFLFILLFCWQAFFISLEKCTSYNQPSKVDITESVNMHIYYLRLFFRAIMSCPLYLPKGSPTKNGAAPIMAPPLQLFDASRQMPHDDNYHLIVTKDTAISITYVDF